MSTPQFFNSGGGPKTGITVIEENLCENENICQLLEDKNRLNTWLLDWLLNNEALYKEIIVKLKRIKLKK